MERRLRPSAYLLMALSILVLGCDSTDPDIFSLWVRIEGSVTTMEGSPVGDALIEFRAMYDGREVGGEVTCTAYPDAPEVASTGSNGFYSTVLQGSNLHLIECVEVIISPPGGSGLHSVTDTIHPTEASRDRDSAPVNRLDVELSPLGEAYEMW